MFYKLMNELNFENDLEKRTMYKKLFGWTEIDPDDARVDVGLRVLDVSLGYNVYRQGKNGVEMLYWNEKIDNAVEWAIDYAREEISKHKANQMQQEVNQMVNGDDES